MYVHAVSGDDRMTIRLDGASQVKPGDAILLAVNMNRAVFLMPTLKTPYIEKGSLMIRAPLSLLMIRLPDFVRPFRMVDKRIAVMLIVFVNDFVPPFFLTVDGVLLIPFEQNGQFSHVRS